MSVSFCESHELGHSKIPAQRAVNSAQLLLQLVSPPRFRERKVLSTKPVPGAGSPASGLIGGICQSTFVDRKASATDALREPVSEALKFRHHMIDTFRPCPVNVRSRRKLT